MLIFAQQPLNLHLSLHAFTDDKKEDYRILTTEKGSIDALRIRPHG